MHDRSILPVRIALLILLGLVSLANELGMELVLGAYTAGMVIAMLVRDTRAEILQNRLMSIGSGFFIPVFFITSGVEFDLPGLLTSPGSIARLILFCAGFLLIRTIPVRLYKGVLPENDLLPLALLSSTTLPLVVAVTYPVCEPATCCPRMRTPLSARPSSRSLYFPPWPLCCGRRGKARNPKAPWPSRSTAPLIWPQ